MVTSFLSPNFLLIVLRASLTTLLLPSNLIVCSDDDDDDDDVNDEVLTFSVTISDSICIVIYQFILLIYNYNLIYLFFTFCL